MSITLSNPFVPQIENESVQSSFILDLLPAFVFYIDKDQCFKYINRSFEVGTGIIKEFAIGKSMKEAFDADTIKRLMEYADKTLSGIHTEFETELSFKGITQLFEVSFQPDTDETGNVNGFVAFMKPQAERKVAELKISSADSLTSETHDAELFKAIKDSENQYRQLVNGLPAAIYTCDAEGRILMYNEAAARLWGREPEIGKDLWCGSMRIYYPDGTPVSLDECPMAITLKEGRPINLAEIVVERPDGQKLNVLANPKPIFDSTGKLVQAVNMLIDFTELKWAEQALRESEERFYKVADSAPVMIWMSGIDKQYNYFNNRWLDFTGRYLEQETGKGWMGGIHPDDFEYCMKTYSSSFEKQEEFKMEFRLKRFDGEYRWMLNNGRPRFSPDGTFKGYIGSCIDVTDNKLMAEALEKEVELRTKELQIANDQLLRYNEELEQFAYAASHDLQEPLRKIQTFAGMLAERNSNELNDAGKNYLSKIIKSTERMSGIIEDLLYYSRQTRMDELFEETDLNIIVENVLSDLELIIQQKGAEIEYETLPCMRIIPSQINRLFYNLINNSLKFSNPGVPPIITISVKHHFLGDDENRPAFIELLVQDNGIGFEQKYADRIFQLFQRLNDKHSYNGNGIGLALCKKIVQNHKGDIFAEAKPNTGATFHIKFPASILVEEKAASIC